MGADQEGTSGRTGTKMKISPSTSEIRPNLEKFLTKIEPFLISLGFAYLGLYSWQVLALPTGLVGASLEIGGWVIYVIFALELVVRVVIRSPILRTFSGWLLFFRENWLIILAASLPAFRSFRVLKVLLILRGIYPYVKSRMAKAVAVVGVALPIIIYTSSLAVLQAERGNPEAPIQSFADALWWSTVTITTVGYGDAVPITPDGRVVGTFLIFSGIGLFSTLTALIASWVMKDSKLERE